MDGHHLDIAGTRNFVIFINKMVDAEEVFSIARLKVWT